MKMTRGFKVVSFYTPSYAGHARRLEASLERHLPSVPRDVVAIGEETWERATCLKGAFVRDQLKASDRPVLWIDADAELRGLIELPDVDFAIYARFASKLRQAWSPFRSGTVYFGKSPAAQQLADRWAEECAAQSDGVDQWALYRAWAALTCAPGAVPSTAWLPQALCCKNNEPGASKALILHHMASRSLRRR